MKLPEELSEWTEAIFGIYYELVTNEICGLGNGVIVGSFGDRALALTAAHNSTALEKLAVGRSPFESLKQARENNAHFRSQVRFVIAERHVGREQDLSEIRQFLLPLDGDTDVALALLHRTSTSRFNFQRHFGMKLLPPPVGDRVVAVGMHGFALQDVEDVGDGRGRWVFKNDCVCVPARVTSHTVQGYMRVDQAFEVEGEFPSGLSGSPVLWVQGDQVFVAGVVSRSFEGVNQTLVASAQTALRIEVPGRMHADQAPAETTSVYELARRGDLPTYGNEIEHFVLTDGMLGLRASADL